MMKYLSFCIQFFGIAFLLMSCKKSTINNPSPVLVMQTRAGYVASNSTVNKGDSVRLAWSALRGGNEMLKCEVTINGINFVGFNGGKAKELLGGERNAFIDSIKFKAMNTNTYVIRVSSENLSSSLAIQVVVAKDLKVFNDIKLGEDTKYFWSSEVGKVLSDVEYIASPSNVDVSFATLGDTSAPFLLSSAQRPAEGLNVGVLGIKTFFRISELDFEKATAADVNGVATSGGAQKILIKVGEVYEFVNAFGKKGIIKIKSINASSSLKKVITFDLKVQE
ncbi:MAG: hypothetical protein EAZ07_02220 [Cytophagales bacterium]|nr:MAG: hypothetical protein EAZ07_02220 [Cytophagales bacterium]